MSKLKIVLIVVVGLVVLGGGVFAAKMIIPMFSTPKDVSADALLPADVSMALVVDHSNPEQLKNLQGIMAMIPNIGVMEGLVADFNKNATPGFTYETFQPILDGNWKIALGMKLPEDKSKIMNLMGSGNGPDFAASGIEVYAVLKTDQADKVQDLLNTLATQGKLEYAGTDKSPLWNVKEDTATPDQKAPMIVRYGNVYFLAMSEQQKQDILTRIDDENGFDKSEKLTKNLELLGPRNLGYLYVDGKAVIGLVKGLAGFGGLSLPTEMADALGDVFLTVSADASGIRLASKTYMAAAKEIMDKYYPDYQLSLVNKVPGEGMILYVEKPAFGIYMESFLKGLSSGAKAASGPLEMLLTSTTPVDVAVDENVNASADVGAGATVPVVPVKKVSRERGHKSILDSGPTVPKVETPVVDEKTVVEDTTTDPKTSAKAVLDQVVQGSDLYGMLMDNLASVSGLTADDIKAIFAGPYAFAVSDPGGLVPAIAFYLKVDQAAVENAKTLVSSGATYVDQIISELDKQLRKTGMSGVIKKEVKVLDGAALQRVYLDWTKVPAPMIEQYNKMIGSDVSKVKVEFYYGVTNDGVFVFALYPDFADKYAKDVLADTGFYKEGVTSAGTVYGYSVGMFRVSPLLDLAQRYLGIVKNAMLIDDAIAVQYEKITTAISSFKYVFESNSKEADGMRNGAYFKFEKAEFSQELQQKIQAQKESEANAQNALNKAQGQKEDLYGATGGANGTGGASDTTDVTKDGGTPAGAGTNAAGGESTGSSASDSSTTPETLPSGL